MSTSASAISAGTIARKAELGRRRSRTAPMIPPVTEALPSRRSRERWPVSSGRMARAPEADPGTRPTLLDTLAVTGAYPRASSTGKVISVPEPTTVLIVPAASPAASTRRASGSVIRRAGCHARPQGALRYDQLWPISVPNPGTIPPLVNPSKGPDLARPLHPRPPARRHAARRGRRIGAGHEHRHARRLNDHDADRDHADDVDARGVARVVRGRRDRVERQRAVGRVAARGLGAVQPRVHGRRPAAAHRARPRPGRWRHGAARARAPQLQPGSVITEPARHRGRRASTSRRIWRAVLVAGLVAGTLLVLDGLLTILWQEPV